MFCPKCGKETPDDSQFCPKCARPMNAPPVVPPQPKRNWGSLKWFVLGVLVCLLLFTGNELMRTGTQNGGPKQISPLAQMLARPQSAPLLNTSIDVHARSFFSEQFTVPGNSTAVSVEGHFTASGGLGNDIEVYLMSADGFVNFQNGHSPQTYYSSGKLTQGSFDVPLPDGGGTYYMVFSNRFGLLATKTVQVSSTLHLTL